MSGIQERLQQWKATRRLKAAINTFVALLRMSSAMLSELPDAATQTKILEEVQADKDRLEVLDEAFKTLDRDHSGFLDVKVSTSANTSRPPPPFSLLPPPSSLLPPPSLPDRQCHMRLWCSGLDSANGSCSSCSSCSTRTSAVRVQRESTPKCRSCVCGLGLSRGRANSRDSLEGTHVCLGVGLGRNPGPETRDGIQAATQSQDSIKFSAPAPRQPYATLGT
jgi:hypothetical protein